jgi:hypothetical protein
VVARVWVQNLLAQVPDRRRLPARTSSQTASVSKSRVAWVVLNLHRVQAPKYRVFTAC